MNDVSLLTVTKLIFRSNTEEDDDFPGDFEEELALMDQNDSEIGLNETESQESTEQVSVVTTSMQFSIPCQIMLS